MSVGFKPISCSRPTTRLRLRPLCPAGFSPGWLTTWPKGSRWELTLTRKGVNLWRRLLLRWPHVPRPLLFAIGFLFAAVQDMQFSARASNSLSEGCSDQPCLPRVQKEVIPLGSFEAFMDKTFDTEARPAFNTPRLSLSFCGWSCAWWCFVMLFRYLISSQRHLLKMLWPVPVSVALLGLPDDAYSSCLFATPMLWSISELLILRDGSAKLTPELLPRKTCVAQAGGICPIHWWVIPTGLLVLGSVVQLPLLLRVSQLRGWSSKSKS
jgi:hypothetical protein